MSLIATKFVIGFVVGVLIGMSGVGGGVRLLPVLIFGLRVPAIVAVGSDALFNFFTKVPASLMHVRKGTVRWKVVMALAVASIPGSIGGVKLLMYIRHLCGNGVKDFIKSAVGALFIVIPLLLLFQKQIEGYVANRPPTMQGFAGMAVIVLIAGSLVGMTSVGSGSIILMLLWAAADHRSSHALAAMKHLPTAARASVPQWQLLKSESKPRRQSLHTPCRL